MKKALFLLGILLFTLAPSMVKSQDVNEQQKKKYVYCELVWNEGFIKSTITINFGSNVKLSKDKRFMGEDGKPISFSSIVDGLNHMDKDGWRLFKVYGLPDGSSKKYFLLRKAVESYNELELSGE